MKNRLTTKRNIIKDAKHIDTKKESFIQKRYFEWVFENSEKYPELKTIFHIPNGLHTSNFGMIIHFKQMGLRKGVWDVFIPISRSGYASCWIEFKREDVRRKLSPEQLEFKNLITQLTNNKILFISELLNLEP